MRLSCTNLCILNLAIFHFLCFSSPTYALKNKNNNETDRLALLEFKSKITNDPLGVMSSWNNSFHFCQWYGVKCGRRHQRVTVLDLSSLMLSGFISPHVGNLSFLREFSLQNNSFTHEIPPQIGNLHRLQILSLCNNSIGGKIPSAIISNSSNLVTIDFSNNKLDGEIPQELGCLLKLKYVYLYKNNLTGTLPPSLGNLSSLQHLYVSENRLRRNLPHTLGKLKSLKKLSIHENQFSGKVPTEGIFKNASATSVAGNQRLCGGIPDFGLPACKSEKPNKRITIKLKIIISTLSVAISAALVLTYLFLCYSKKKKEGSASTSFGNALLNLSYQSLLKATDGFSSNNLIGTGSFGSVYKGILNPEGIVIAVKVLNLHRQGALKSFIAECAAIRNIRHRNLVKVLTACSSVDYQGNDFKALVYEFMNNGSLDHWLHPILRPDEVPRTLNVLQRLNIAIDVACALEYLHVHCGVPIVHCDLKPNNILLDQEMTAHVSDFGLVKFLSNDMIDSANQFSSLGLRGTFGYCPPEYGVGSEVSTSGDIFSFGVLLLEMFTGKRPTDDMFKESFNLHNFVKKALPEHVTQVIDLNLLNMQLNVDATPNHNHNFTRRNNILTECLISILEIGISCSVEFPQERMKVDDVIAQLSSVRKKFLEGRN